jgi:predicted PurR-regulated permease PerM
VTRRSDPRSAQEVQLPLSFAVRVAVTLVGALLVLVVLARSRLVLHWLLTAGVAALLLDGPVRGLVDRRVPRALAVLLVTVGTVVGAVLLTYGAVDAVVEQYGNLSETAPEAVADLTRSGGLADVERRFDLVARTSDLVATAPERLLGSPASVARTAAERLGEVVLVLTLTVFMLVAYERFEQRLLRMNAAGHPWRWVGVDLGLSIGASRARHVVLRVLALGAVTALVAAVAGAPGPVVLGLWVAWWRLLPGLGIVVGHAPLVLLLVTGTSQLVTAVALLVLLGAEVVARAADLHWAIRATPDVPMGFLSALAFTGGFELGGVPGAVVAVVLGHLLVGVLQEAAGADRSRPAEGGRAGTVS